MTPLAEPNEAALKVRAAALLDSYGDRMPFGGLERQLVISLMCRFAADAIVHELVTLTGADATILGEPQP